MAIETPAPIDRDLFTAALAWTGIRQNYFGIPTAAVPDVARVMLQRGVMELDGAGGVRARAGEQPEAIVARMKDDEGCAHYFTRKATPAAMPKADPSKMSAALRLEHANAEIAKVGK